MQESDQAYSSRILNHGKVEIGIAVERESFTTSVDHGKNTKAALKSAQAIRQLIEYLINMIK